MESNFNNAESMVTVKHKDGQNGDQFVKTNCSPLDLLLSRSTPMMGS